MDKVTGGQILAVTVETNLNRHTYGKVWLLPLKVEMDGNRYSNGLIANYNCKICV